MNSSVRLRQEMEKTLAIERDRQVAIWHQAQIGNYTVPCLLRRVVDSDPQTCFCDRFPTVNLDVAKFVKCSNLFVG
jgi:hypothetical protein